MTKHTNRLVWGLAAVLAGLCLCWSNFTPFTPGAERQARYREFRGNLRRLEAIVALARAGKLAPADPSEDQHWKKLSFWDRGLSDGGEVYVIQPHGNTTVIFYIFRGLMTGGRWSAYYYVADGMPPFQGDDQEEMAPHWYWVTGN